MDPPESTGSPTILTWTEQERVRGIGPGSIVAADPAVLTWLGIAGGHLLRDEVLAFRGWQIVPVCYPPIPYATFAEALRKTRSALRDPRRAVGRISFALGRPRVRPLAIAIERGGRKVAHLGQALHRFLPPGDLVRLHRVAEGADVVVAGTDYGDEEATGRLLGTFAARVHVVADLVGPIRRALELPEPSLRDAMAPAPPGTRLLYEGEAIALDV